VFAVLDDLHRNEGTLREETRCLPPENLEHPQQKLL